MLRCDGALLETTGRGRWYGWVAVLLPDDDTSVRSRTMGYQWDAAIGRAMASTPLTIRIDLIR